MKPIAPTTTELSRDEQRLLGAFRAMNDRCQQSLLPVAEAWAKRAPRRARPMLRMVKGGAA